MAGKTDLSLMGSDELEDHLAEHRKELFNLRFQLATGQLDNTARMGQARREIARAMTLLREREILEAEGLYGDMATGHDGTDDAGPGPVDSGNDVVEDAGDEEDET
jgi:large subunit ribosomal protein L29